MVPQHWALRHSFWYVVPHLGSTIVPSHPTIYRPNMWSSWVRRKGTTQVMYVAKLKDGQKTVKKILSMLLERVFEMVWWRGENGITLKRIFVVEAYFSSQNVKFSFSFSFSFSLSLSLSSVSWGFRSRWYLRRKSLLQKLLFKYFQHTGGGRIFWSGVMHTNMAKPWLWR
jgi:hypothetical protein